MLGVFDKAIRRFGRPRHFVSDQGSQFTAAAFQTTLVALGIQQRFGAIGQYGSIAIIERFWRTLKAFLAVKLRPHQGLGGATPWEVLDGKRPAAATEIPPPRTGKRQPPGVGPLPLHVAFLDAQHQLPVLILSDLAA